MVQSSIVGDLSESTVWLKLVGSPPEALGPQLRGVHGPLQDYNWDQVLCAYYTMHRWVWVLQGSWVSGDRTKINGLWPSLQEYGAVYRSVTRIVVGESAAWHLASEWFSSVLDFTRASLSHTWTTKLPQRYFRLYMHAQLHSRVWLFVTPQTTACQAPLFLESSRQESWSGFAFPSPRDLLDPGIKPMFLTSPALVGGFYHEHHVGSPLCPWMDAKLLLLRGGIREDILFGHLAFITLHNVGFLIQFFSMAC